MTGTIPPHEIEEARTADIRELWARLGLPALPEHGNVRSPFREDHNPTCEVGGAKNIFHDFGSGETLDTIGIVRRVKSCDFPDAVSFILGRSVNGRTAGPVDPVDRLAGVRGWTPAALRSLGAVGRGDEVHFPMRDGSGAVTGWRRRRGDGGKFDGGEKCLTVSGGKNGLLCAWPLPDGDLLLVEGEADAAAALSAGWLAVVGTPGATPGRVVEQALQRVLAGRTVILAPDPDAAGERWREKMGRTLSGARCEVRFIPPLADLDLDARLRHETDQAAALARLVSEALVWTDPKPAAVEWQAGAVDDLFRLTDLGNAERFRVQHGDRALYDPAVGWRVWDGRRWASDTTGEVHRLAHATARSLFGEAAREKNPDAAQKIGQHAIKSQSRDRLHAIVDVAQTLMAVDPARFDTDPWVLNCPNGTVESRTGKLRPHRREDFITKLAGAIYDPAATHPIFETVKDRAMPDPEVRRYAQKLCGITLVGEQVDDLFILMYGQAGTMKTTFAEPFKKALGEYGATVEPESLQVTGRGGGGNARGDIARLAGVRLAITTEVEDGAKLAVGLVKRLCGGDTITARKVYRDDFEFTPRFTLWIVSNHRPKADSADDGLWRRVKVLPFDQVIPEAERDPKVKAAMLNECLPAFLRWAVDGVKLYMEEGLRTPAAVKDAVRDYQEAMDPLKDFLDSCCVIDPNERVDNASLRKTYLEFCEQEGCRYSLGPKAFGERLRTMGFRPTKFNGARGWEGITVSWTDRTDRTDSTKTFSRNPSYRKVMDSSVQSVQSVQSTQNTNDFLDRLAARGVTVKLDDAGRVVVLGSLTDPEAAELRSMNGVIQSCLEGAADDLPF